MVRPCFLVLDPEHAASISTRKLVIETAKLNCITAYAAAELLETLDRFPAVHGIVINANMRDMSCAEVVSRIRESHPGVPIVVVGTAADPCDGDYNLTNYDPANLLEVLKKVEPRKYEFIQRHDEELSAQDG